jgi:hypothetical protein
VICPFTVTLGAFSINKPLIKVTRAGSCSPLNERIKLTLSVPVESLLKKEKEINVKTMKK